MSAISNTDFSDRYPEAIPMAPLPEAEPQENDRVMNTSENAQKIFGIFLFSSGLLTTAFSSILPKIVGMDPKTAGYVDFFGSFVGIFMAAAGFKIIDSSFATFHDRVDRRYV